MNLTAAEIKIKKDLEDQRHDNKMKELEYIRETEIMVQKNHIDRSDRKMKEGQEHRKTQQMVHDNEMERQGIFK